VRRKFMTLDNKAVTTEQAKDFIKKLKQLKVKNLIIKFTIPSGEFCQAALWVSVLKPIDIQKGVPLSGIYEGWRSVAQSDSILLPDITRIFQRPYQEEKSPGSSVMVFGSIANPITFEAEQFDGRMIALKAIRALQESGIGDECKIGPELEFSVFNDVSFGSDVTESFFRIDEPEYAKRKSRYEILDYNAHPVGVSTMHHHPAHKDSYFDFRALVMQELENWKYTPKSHIHEDHPGQNEVNIQHGNLLEMADFTQMYKYLVHETAKHKGKVATFMPQPVSSRYGNGHHINISIWKEGKNIFSGDEPGGISKVALHFIGGIMQHAKALNAICNPSVNSYRRLANHYNNKMPVNFELYNRVTPIRIPAFREKQEARIEIRFPDCMANPYLAYSAVLMAGIDGIKQKIDAVALVKKNQQHGSHDQTIQQFNLRTPYGFSRDLYEAAISLLTDSAFLRAKDVFIEPVLMSIINQAINSHEDLIRSPTVGDFYMSFSR